MPAIRVMLVDDAVVVRRVLQDSLKQDPELEIVAVASDGIDALEKIAAARPDVVVLDVEMPRMDGIETLANIKRLYKHVRVVMFSTLTSRGAEATLDALSMGADDYVTKPSNTAGLADAMSRVRGELVPKIKALAPANRNQPATAPGLTFNRFAPRTDTGAPRTDTGAPRTDTGAPRTDTRAPRTDTASAQSGGAQTPTTPVHPGTLAAATASGPIARPAVSSPNRPATPARPAALRTGMPTRVDVVVIAVSTGGPNALMEVIPHLPADLSVPVVMVQHIPPVFSKALADRLNGRSPLEVAEAYDNCPVQPGKVWVAPGDYHITFSKAGANVVLRTNQGPPENSCRPAADVLFRSATELYGSHVLGVVLTGMGYDGTKGSVTVTEAGGSVIAQDQATSVVWGMPGSVVEAGLVSGVFPLHQIATEIITRVGHSARRAGVPTSPAAARPPGGF